MQDGTHGAPRAPIPIRRLGDGAEASTAVFCRPFKRCSVLLVWNGLRRIISFGGGGGGRPVLAQRSVGNGVGVVLTVEDPHCTLPRRLTTHPAVSPGPTQFRDLRGLAIGHRALRSRKRAVPQGRTRTTSARPRRPHGTWSQITSLCVGGILGLGCRGVTLCVTLCVIL